MIAQIFVHGESIQSYIIAVIVPDPDALKKWFMERCKCIYVLNYVLTMS